jgi:hypothetical protein
MFPHLPSKWDYMRLKHVKAFNSDFNIDVTREGNKLRLKVTDKGKEVLNTLWDGKEPVKVEL